jgi:Mannosyl-glycoprotein endo-beta-N-acetylglucosaminidase
MSLFSFCIAALVLGCIVYVALFTGRKDVAPAPVPSAATGRRGCMPFLIVLIVCVIAVAVAMSWPPFSSFVKNVSAAAQSISKPSSTQTVLSSHSSSTSSSDSVVGDPDISAAFIDNVLLQAHSPAQGLGQTLYDEGKQYHIKPSFALSIFHMESDYGLKGVAPTLHSLGNIRSGPNSYRSYVSWSDSVADFYHLIATVYIASGLTTVAQIMPIYAPASDHNNPDAYIQVVRTDMTTWSES